MPWPVTINGRTYAAADFAPYGYTISFPNIVQDIADIGATAQTIVSGVNYGNSYRNRIRNGAFQVNQRAVSGTVTLAAGKYGHDGWKAGAGGCTYTFAASGSVTTLTITAGTLLQVIEGGLYLPEGGSYTLSWLGTAQARAYQGSAGSYAASPVTATGLAAGINTTVEFSTGTLSLPMFEPGTKRTAFEYRDDELRRCQRYFQTSYTGVAPGTANAPAAFAANIDPSQYFAVCFSICFPVTMRATPTMTMYSPKTGAAGYSYANNQAVDVPVYVSAVSSFSVTCQVSGTQVSSGLQSNFTASAEL